MLYLHTNIVSPYRLHQFRAIARLIPDHCILLYSLVYKNKESVWTDDLWKGEPFKVKRIASQDVDSVGKGAGCFSWRLLWILLTQKWGTVHVVGAGVRKLNLKMLQLSGLLGHSRIVTMCDGIRKGEIQKDGRTRFGKFLHKHCYDAHWVNGAFAIERLKRFGIPESRIINQYFSCDDEKYEKFRMNNYETARSGVRQALHVGERDFCILTISRFIELKRLKDVACALLALERENSVLARRIVWVCIGDGDCREHEIIMQKSQTVRYVALKPMPAAAVMNYYCAADVFVFPSDRDVWGLVVNEALSMGVPVICSEEVGAASLIRDGQNGYQVPIHSPDDIKGSLVKILADDALRERMKISAVDRMKQWRSSMGVELLSAWMGGR